MQPKNLPGQPPAGLPQTPQPQRQSIDGFSSPLPAPSDPLPPAPPPITGPALPQINATPQQNSQNIKKVAQNGEHLGQFKGFAWFVAFIGGVFVVAFLINQFVFHSYFVEGTSMVPNLQNNDRLIIEKVSRSFSFLQGKHYMPERGQIVVLNSSLIAANGSHEQLIKRVIGLPGDKIFIKDGTVTIKNQENPDGFDVDKQLNLDVEPTYSSEPLDFEVPDDHVFVMGDNRTQNGSHDSRAFGPVATTDLEGRLWARILPINKAQIFP